MCIMSGFCTPALVQYICAAHDVPAFIAMGNCGLVDGWIVVDKTVYIA